MIFWKRQNYVENIKLSGIAREWGMGDKEEDRVYLAK